MTRKVIVIGAGIGGLAAALELKAAGFDVSLHEAAAEPGGKMRELQGNGNGIDSGPTVFTMRWVFDTLFQRLGTRLEEHVELQEAECVARHSWLDGGRLDLFADLEASVSAIREFAGDSEAQAYRRFAARSGRVFETLDESFMRAPRPGMFSLTRSVGFMNVGRLLETSPFTSLWKELGGVFRDPRLRQLFGRYSTYCGSSPIESPATLMLIAHAERSGVWIVRNGMQRFADALSALAVDKGVTLNFNSRVDEIVCREGRASGVRLQDGTVEPADAVVFNGDVKALSDGLLGEAVEKALPDRRDEVRSLSALTWSLRGRSEGFPLHYHTVFFGGDYPSEFSAIFERASVCDEPTVYVCAQDRVSGERPAGEERLFVLMNAPPRSLTEDEMSDYEQRVFSLLSRHGLEIDIASVTRTAPQDFAARFPGSDGAIYGWPTHGWSGSFRRAGSSGRVPGLYFAGGTVHPGPGVPMTALSGRLAAEQLAKDLG